MDVPYGVAVQQQIMLQQEAAFGMFAAPSVSWHAAGEGGNFFREAPAPPMQDYGIRILTWTEFLKINLLQVCLAGVLSLPLLWVCKSSGILSWALGLVAFAVAEKVLAQYWGPLFNVGFVYASPGPNVMPALAQIPGVGAGIQAYPYRRRALLRGRASPTYSTSVTETTTEAALSPEASSIFSITDMASTDSLSPELGSPQQGDHSLDSLGGGTTDYSYVSDYYHSGEE